MDQGEDAKKYSTVLLPALPSRIPASNCFITKKMGLLYTSTIGTSSRSSQIGLEKSWLILPRPLR